MNTRRAGKLVGHKHVCTVGKTYIQVRIDGTLHYAHRIVWVMLYGPIPSGEEIDHIDGDGTNNRAANLRLADSSINKRNQRRLPTNTSGATGVYVDKRRGGFDVAGHLNDRKIYIGHAATFEEAVAMRRAFNVLHGFHENHGTDRPL